MAKLVTTADAIEGLRAVAAIPGADAVSITVQSWPDARTAAAGQAISNAGRWQHSRETVIQLEKALTSRSDIDMAKGALMALCGCDPREAFARLVDESQRRNIKVRDVAIELLARLKVSP